MFARLKQVAGGIGGAVSAIHTYLRWIGLIGVVGDLLKDFFPLPSGEQWEDRAHLEKWLVEFAPELAAVIAAGAKVFREEDESDEESDPHIIGERIKQMTLDR